MHDTRSLLALDGLDFIEAAYALALGRAADPSGLRNYLQHLQNGVSKEHILNELQNSEEGRIFAARAGLAGKQTAGPESNGPMTLPQLLALEDEDFVVQAYRTALGRDPDNLGLSNYLTELRQGTPRVKVLQRLRDSPEGLEQNTVIDGLSEALADDAEPRWRVSRLVKAMSRRVRTPRPAEANTAQPSDEADPLRMPSPPASSLQFVTHRLAQQLDRLKVATGCPSPDVSTSVAPYANDPASPSHPALLPPLRLERFMGDIAQGFSIGPNGAASCAVTIGGCLLGQLQTDQPRIDLQSVYGLSSHNVGFAVPLGGLLQFAVLAVNCDLLELSQPDHAGIRQTVPLAPHYSEALSFLPLQALARLAPKRRIGSLLDVRLDADHECRLLFQADATSISANSAGFYLDAYQERTPGEMECIGHHAIEPAAQLAYLSLRLLSRHAPILLVVTDVQHNIVLTDCIALPELHAEHQRALIDYHSLLAGGRETLDVVAGLARVHLESEQIMRHGPPAAGLPVLRSSTAIIVFSRDCDDFDGTKELEAAQVLALKAGLLLPDGRVRQTDGNCVPLQQFIAGDSLRHVLLLERRVALRPDFWAVLQCQAFRLSDAIQLVHWHSIWMDGTSRPWVVRKGLPLSPALARHELQPLHAALVTAPLVRETLQARGADTFRSGRLAPEHVFSAVEPQRVTCIPLVMDTVTLPWVPYSPVRQAVRRQPMPRPPTETPGLSVIVNYRNGVEDTLRCLDALKAQNYPGPLEVILVDNDSTLHSNLEVSRRARELFDATSLQLLSYPGRFNHSAQCNLAAKAARHPLLLILGSDAQLVTPDALAFAAEAASIPWVATVGFRIVGGQPGSHREQTLGLVPSPRQVLTQGGPPLSPLRPLTPMLGRTVETLGNPFIAALLRREVYLQLGGLDAEAFPSNYNDVDFCCRALQQGYRHLSIGSMVVKQAGQAMNGGLAIDQRILDRCPPLHVLAGIGVVEL